MQGLRLSNILSLWGRLVLFSAIGLFDMLWMHVVHRIVELLWGFVCAFIRARELPGAMDDEQQNIYEERRFRYSLLVTTVLSGLFVPFAAVLPLFKSR